jgi:hypothetical protein
VLTDLPAGATGEAGGSWPGQSVASGPRLGTPLQDIASAFQLQKDSARKATKPHRLAAGDDQDHD